MVEAGDFIIDWSWKQTLLICPANGCDWEECIDKGNPSLDDLRARAERHIEEAHPC